MSAPIGTSSACYNLGVDAEETVEKQPAAHLKPFQFKPGQSGNPGGRPQGAISIVAKIKKKFEENPEYFDEWVDELLKDRANRRAVMEQIDGKPHQTTDITSGGEKLPTPILMNVPSDEGGS